MTVMTTVAGGDGADSIDDDDHVDEIDVDQCYEPIDSAQSAPHGSSERTVELIASKEEASGQRLDQYIALKISDLSRTRVRKLIDEGMVFVDQSPGKAGMKLRGNETITVTTPPIEALEVAAEAIPLEIVYQDEDLAVINKPVAMITHPGAGVTSGTLVNALLHHLKGQLSGISGVARPGIVHRLDKDTSGLLVIAKNDLAHRHLQEQIKRKDAQRIYMALVEGTVKDAEGTIDKKIGRHPTKRKQMAVVETGREAVSHYRVMQRFTKYTLIKVQLETGRTHQIRVHMASIGYPVVGDLVYNTKQTGTEAARRKLGLIGHALHAFQLRFRHPVTGLLLEFESPLPGDFQSMLQALK